MVDSLQTLIIWQSYEIDVLCYHFEAHVYVILQHAVTQESLQKSDPAQTCQKIIFLQADKINWSLLSNLGVSGTMNCPGCGEKNDGDMHFCISCGQALTSQGAASKAAQQMPTEEIQIQPGGNMVLFCPLCKKTDPLNGQFCVYCAGRTVPMVDPQALAAPSVRPTQPSAPSPSYASSSTADSVLVNNAIENAPRSEEIVRITAQQPRVANNNLSVALSVLLGAVFAGSLVFFARTTIEKTSLAGMWPSEGVLILSSEPNADVKLESTRKDTLILGKTSADGSVQIQNISPGQYLLSLSNKSKSFGKMFSHKAGEASIIGYPVRLKID
jgi:hypothetical protein